MIRKTERKDYFATKCTACGRLLTNPGYGRLSVYCCGKNRRWFSPTYVTTAYDDGRDERGRYHHRAHHISTERDIWDVGGS
jgi:hypothetical protein